jgi:uncharacterized protein
MSQIIGREREIEVMQSAIKSSNAHFMAVYGRRRVGKTFLIKNVYREHLFLEMVGVKGGSLLMQLRGFNESLAEAAVQHGLPKPKKHKNWLDAFFELKRLIQQSNRGEKKVIFFDELPWIDTHRSGFLPALEHFWNSWAGFESDIVLVICGSSASWMIRKVVNNKGGLYNRLTDRIRLLPFTLEETERYLFSKHLSFNRFEIVHLYMVMGGIPQYLSQIKPGRSAYQIIEQFCFDPDGVLYQEFDNLYIALFDEAEHHLKIISALASTRQGLSREELLIKTKLPNAGSSTRILEELEQSNFIEAYAPIDKKTKSTLFRLTDFYSLFYLSFIEGNKKGKASTNVWDSISKSGAWMAYRGYAFENICLLHLPQIRKALGIQGIYSTAGSWKGKSDDGISAQIDLLIDRADHVITLCEMKFSQTEFTVDKDYADNLRRKMSVFNQVSKNKKHLQLCLISTFGVSQNMHSLGFVAHNLTFDILFEKA